MKRMGSFLLYSLTNIPPRSFTCFSQASASFLKGPTIVVNRPVREIVPPMRISLGAWAHTKVVAKNNRTDDNKEIKNVLFIKTSFEIKLFVRKSTNRCTPVQNS